MATFATHAGASETPSPAATNRTRVGHCGASCTMFGRNPFRSQQAIVLSNASGPIRRANKMNGSFRRSRTRSERLRASACATGSTATYRSSNNVLISIPSVASPSRRNARSSVPISSAEICADVRKFPQAQLHLRIAPPVTSNSRRKIGKHHRPAEPNRERPFLPASQPPHLRQVVLNFFDRAPRPLGEQLAGQRQLHAPRRPIEKPMPEQLFQPFDLLAQGRLGDP